MSTLTRLTHVVTFCRTVAALTLLGVLTLVMLGAGYAVVNAWPDLGAQGAETLRRAVGDQAVAQLETLVFEVQDAFASLAYRLGLIHPESAWMVTPQVSGPAPMPLPAAATLRTAESHVKAPAVSAPAASAKRSSLPKAGSSIRPTPAPTPTTSPAWMPSALPALGTLTGEGQWQSYLQGPSGQTVAYRTFLQPDPQRPYAVAAMVAFDLNATRLKFVLGSSEPESTVTINRPGRIPANDLRSGTLLAAFNGGFKARHGHFGVGVNGITVLPPRDGHGVVALYADGRVRIGAWGTDIMPAPDIVAWRQNGPLIIQNGRINPHTADNAPRDWGYTINSEVAVWRSGLGLSADGRTLYYVAGQNLTVSALAQAMAATGALNAMQLDINNYWVHFDSFQPGPNGPQPQALLDAMSGQNDQRFLGSYTRDFFYLTAKSGG